MTPTETIKQSIEALEMLQVYAACTIHASKQPPTPTDAREDFDDAETALTNLRALLADMEKVEPVQVLRCPGEEDEFASIVKRLNAALHTTSMANANLRTENESLRLELGKWREWLAENKVALKQARAEALREAADYLESYEFQKTISPSQHYPESAELRRMADEVAKNKH